MAWSRYFSVAWDNIRFAILNLQSIPMKAILAGMCLLLAACDTKPSLDAQGNPVPQSNSSPGMLEHMAGAAVAGAAAGAAGAASHAATTHAIKRWQLRKRARNIARYRR